MAVTVAATRAAATAGSTASRSRSAQAGASEIVRYGSSGVEPRLVGAQRDARRQAQRDELGRMPRARRR